MKLQSVLTELFSQSLRQKLAQKFQDEHPNLDVKTIEYYLQRFEQLKNSPKVQEKDITKYTWKQLETLVDMNQPKSYDKNVKISDSDLIYKNNNLRIYQANSQEACVKYGNGYSFCISARSEGNMYSSYRLDEEFTIYFVFDDSRTKESHNDEFLDPVHLLVIMVRTKYDDNTTNLYQITTANNDGEIETDNWYRVAQIQPKLLKLQHLFVNVEPQTIEKKLHSLKQSANYQIDRLTHKHKIHYTSKLDDYRAGPVDIDQYNMVYNILQGKPLIFYQATNEYGDILSQENRTDGMTKEQWKKNVEIIYKDDTDDRYHISQIRTFKLNLSDEYMNYLHDVWKVMKEYLNEKNKLNIK